jgi:hypothetical protein
MKGWLKSTLTCGYIYVFRSRVSDYDDEVTHSKGQRGVAARMWRSLGKELMELGWMRYFFLVVLR